ncbi:MAG: hypothetical protein A2Y07_07190 [Planctomycetes bacterium GWF2_50_10]|nr:MAG: hypothetical protein A2Y07_07190 [Planctomycetes bacterium GWF2_50_10]
MNKFLSRSTINFAVAVVSFLNLLGLALTGCIVKYVLPPGSGGIGRMLHGGDGQGRNIKELWSMTRHPWGDIHFHLSVVFVVLMIIHIALHWNWIQCYIKQTIGKASNK